MTVTWSRIRHLAPAALLMCGICILGSTAAASGTPPPQASAQVGHDSGPAGDDFWLASPEGGVFAFGGAGSYGSAADLPLVHPIVGITPTVDDGGYWLVASD